MDPRWQHPFTCIVAGPTGCGKTTFVARLLRNASEMIDPPPEHVTWYYGEWQAAYKNLDIPNMRMEEGLPTSFDNDGKRGLVVLDDLMAETDERVTNLFNEEEPPLQHVRDISRAESVFKKQRKPYHKFKLAIHDRVQKPARCDANDYIGQTDVPRSSQVCSGGVRRCNVHSLWLSSDRPETEHAR